ncbi:MAG: type II toxin-antitoxin system RelE/ParE family toxin [Schwartzia sp.]|nr:type II toxin-antitoxin system RelE/ParE family toxin [Schwartzia sp. (in: firmicutes)]
MKRYSVEVFHRAQVQLDTIYDYISFQLHAPMDADRLSTRILDAIQTLEFQPERCPQIGLWRGQPLRRLIVRNYSVFYTIVNNIVFVTHILYNRSNIPSRLGKDFQKRQ